MNSGIRYASAKAGIICPSAAIVEEPEHGHPAKGGTMPVAIAVLHIRAAGRYGLGSGLKDRFPRIARVWTDEAYAGGLVEWAEKTDRSWTVQE
jgi:hypothetical protein